MFSPVRSRTVSGVAGASGGATLGGVWDAALLLLDGEAVVVRLLLLLLLLLLGALNQIAAGLLPTRLLDGGGVDVG